MDWIIDNLWLGGVAIVGLVVLQAALMTADGLSRIRHIRLQRRRHAEWLNLRVATAHSAHIKTTTNPATWSGWRKFEVIKKQIEDPAAQVCSFYLAPHDGKPIIPFRPGQFLTFQLDVQGEGKPVVRCYSLSDAHREDCYRVSIKRVPPPRDKPDVPPGLSSNYFHDHINEGSIVDVKAPAGKFYLDLEASKPVVLIGGGIGLTPVLSMLNAIAESGSDRETWFFYGVRNSSEHAMKRHLKEISEVLRNVHIHVCYSNPGDEDVKGQDYDHAERVSVDLFKRLLPSLNYEFYMCGPPPMVATIQDDLAASGIPEDSIHLEKFGPSSRRKAPKEPKPVANGIPVTFKRSNLTASWDPSTGSLWEVAEANGVHIDSGCLEGNCGTCMTAILSGEVEYDESPTAACEDGSCLVCCCKPKGPLELDA